MTTPPIAFLGTVQWLVVLLVAVLLFASRIPPLGRVIGRTCSRIGSRLFGPSYDPPPGGGRS